MARSMFHVNYNGWYALLLLVVTTSIQSSLLTEGTRLLDGGGQKFVQHEGIFDTIEGDDGEVVDCVNLYNQPALSHPRLRDHIIQIKPSLMTAHHDNALSKFTQSWHKNGECSKGTIPVRRQLQTNPNPRQPSETSEAVHRGTEHATVSAFPYIGTKFSGAKATINVWNPSIGRPRDFSSSQIWVSSGYGEDTNILQAGWIVYPDKYGDNRTRLFINWTRDYYRRTGCLDLDCPGFVQVNNKYSLGIAISPISTYNGQQYEIDLAIYQDKTTGHWWVIIEDIPIGYWPAQLFTRFANGADQVMWGGQIYDSVRNEQHTTTEMGSGHFPDQGITRANYFRKIYYFDDVNIPIAPAPGSLVLDVTKPFCYNTVVSQDGDPNGVFIYYGGPGYNVLCP